MIAGFSMDSLLPVRNYNSTQHDYHIQNDQNEDYEPKKPHLQVSFMGRNPANHISTQPLFN